jgi:hypothetical protein
MKKILAAFKKFFRWPYSVYTLIVFLGCIEVGTKNHLFGVLTIAFGIWALIIELTRPKV